VGLRNSVDPVILTKDEPSSSNLSSVKVSSLSSQSLYDLCDSLYTKKNGMVKRRRIEKAEKLDMKKPDLKLKSSEKSTNTTEYNTGPMVEIIDGRIVVKKTSLISNPTQNGAIYDDYDVIEEDNHPKATYSSFLNRRTKTAWSFEDTRLFYHALRQCGLEFTIMQTFFPNRTRKQLKAKYYREEKHHPELITYTLNTNQPIDMKYFEKQLNHDKSSSLRQDSSNGSISLPIKKRPENIGMFQNESTQNETEKSHITDDEVINTS
jgi:transcription factor TFIIIB component B''